MRETLHCPGCSAELTIPASVDGQVQCPRCHDVFDLTSRSSAAVTASLPIATPREEAEDHEQFAPTPRVAHLYPPVGGWFAVVFMITLAANAVVYLLLAFVFLTETRLIALEFVLANHDFLLSVEVTAVFAPWPALLAFVIWSTVAGRNARYLNAVGLMPPSAFLILSFLGCILGAIVGYVHLQQLWRASDPHEVDDSESWRNVPASWTIRAWGMLCIAVPAFIYAAFRFRRNGFFETPAWMAILASFSAAAGFMLLIVIVHRIGRRQFQRYTRLYEDPA